MAIVAKRIRERVNFFVLLRLCMISEKNCPILLGRTFAKIANAHTCKKNQNVSNSTSSAYQKKCLVLQRNINECPILDRLPSLKKCLVLQKI